MSNSPGNLVKVLNKIFEQLQELNQNIENLVGIKDEQQDEEDPVNHKSYNNGYVNGSPRKGH